MKIFVTGATGFIGSELIRELLDENHEVVGLYRDAKKIRISPNDKLSWERCPLADPDRLKDCLQGCDVVFHLAAYARVWAKDRDLYHEINVNGTRNLLHAAMEAGVSKFILTSTAGVLGPSNGSPVDETMARTSEYFTEYERTKSMAEKLVLGTKMHGMRTVVLLPSRLYGPGLLNESNSVTRLIQKYIQGSWRLLPGNGKKIGNYAYIRDVVQGHIRAMHYPGHNERFILGGINIEYRGFFDAIGEVSGQRQWLIPVPSSLIIGISYLLWLRAKVLGHPPLITPGWARKYLHHWKLSSRKAQKELGYKITPLDQALRDTITWLEMQENE